MPASTTPYVSPPPSPPSPTTTSCPTTPFPLPIILILGPPGSGKSTLSTRLATRHDLHHFSVGAWLRSQIVPPITSVPASLNQYVFANEPIPEDVLTAHYSADYLRTAPPALLLYNCTKRNVTTPSEMWIRALPEIRRALECVVIVNGGKSSCRGVLLDNFPKTLAHALAAEKIFGGPDTFPRLIISVSCAEAIAEKRFLARARGSDDGTVFRRRFQRFVAGGQEVMGFYEGREGLKVVRVDAGAGCEEEVFGRLMGELEGCEVWREIVG